MSPHDRAARRRVASLRHAALLAVAATGALSLVGVASAPATAQSQLAAAPAAHVISVATLAPAGSTWMRVLDAWNRELRRRSHAALTLRFYPNGVQGDEAEVVRKIRNGRLDAGAVTAVGLSQIHRPTLAFQLPGIFRTYAQLDRARDAVRADLDTAFDHAGFVLLGWGDAGMDRIFSNRAVLAPADFARTRPFLWRDDLVFPAFLTETGARGVPLQIPEVLTALQTNQIDTVVASPVAVASLQWAPRLTHMTDLAFAPEVGAIVLGKRQFDALPPEHRQLLRETAAQFCQLLVRNVRRDDDATIPSMQQRGLAVDALTPAQRAQWEAVFTRTRARLVGSLGDAAWISRIERAAGAP